MENPVIHYSASVLESSEPLNFCYVGCFWVILIPSENEFLMRTKLSLRKSWACLQSTYTGFDKQKVGGSDERVKLIP